MNLMDMFMVNRTILDEVVERIANGETNFNIESEYGFTPTYEDAFYIKQKLRSKYNIDVIIVV